MYNKIVWEWENYRKNVFRIHLVLKGTIKRLDLWKKNTSGRCVVDVNMIENVPVWSFIH